MDVYTKIYEILDGRYIPEIPKNNNLEDLCVYYFYINNKNFYKNNEIDLHNIIGRFVETLLDSVYDYCINNNIKRINIISGIGNVVRPKVKKYLNYYNMKYVMKNPGNFDVEIYD